MDWACAQRIRARAAVHAARGRWVVMALQAFSFGSSQDCDLCSHYLAREVWMGLSDVAAAQWYALLSNYKRGAAPCNQQDQQVQICCPGRRQSFASQKGARSSIKPCIQFCTPSKLESPCLRPHFYSRVMLHMLFLICSFSPQ